MADRLLSALLAAALSASLAAPPIASAGPATAKAQPAADAPLARAGALAQEAQTLFETADYAGAIELWTQAYAALPDDPAYAAQRSVLAYQIAQACVEAYSLDPQVVYLRKAERLFTGYLQTISPKDKATHDAVEQTLVDLRAKISEAEARAAQARGLDADEAERQRSAAAAEAEAKARKQREAEAEARRVAARRELRKWRGVTVAGGAMIGAGAVMLGVMTFGLARGARLDDDGFAAKMQGTGDPELYQDLLRQGTAANKLAVATGVIGGLFLVSGIGLIAAGSTGQRRARRELAWSPTWLRGGAGLSLVGRF